MHAKIVITAIAGLAVAVLATAALASPAKQPTGLTGVWSGKTHQDIQPLGDDGEIVEWEQRITIRALGGRLTGLAGSFRYTCPSADNPLAGDIALNLGWSSLKKDGPKLSANGGFSLRVTHTKTYAGTKVKLYVPVYITGVLRKNGASGSFSLGNQSCNGKGTWTARGRTL